MHIYIYMNMHIVPRGLKALRLEAIYGDYIGSNITNETYGDTGFYQTSCLSMEVLTFTKDRKPLQT